MYSSTDKFVKLMERKGIKYSYEGVRSNSNNEVVVIKYNCDNVDTITVTFFFNSDCEDASIRIFDLVKVPANKAVSILQTVNKINNTYRFAKFCLDTNDNTIQLEMDPVFRGNDVAEICVELLSRSVNIADEAYPEFMKAIYS